MLKGFLEDGQWDQAQPRSDEEAVDAWLSAMQVSILNTSELTVAAALTAEVALNRARRSGDVVRTARILALKALALAETSDVPALLAAHEDDFAGAARVGDGFVLGMRALALGRWHVGVGGLALSRTIDSKTVAQSALIHLAEAIARFRNQGMDPWEMFAFIQVAKAYADLRLLDEAQRCIDSVVAGLERFPILESHVYEVEGQLLTMIGDERAVKSFRAAVRAAEASGLIYRSKMLNEHLRRTDGVSEPS